MEWWQILLSALGAVGGIATVATSIYKARTDKESVHRTQEQSLIAIYRLEIERLGQKVDKYQKLIEASEQRHDETDKLVQTVSRIQTHHSIKINSLAGVQAELLSRQEELREAGRRQNEEFASRHDR